MPKLAALRDVGELRHSRPLGHGAPTERAGMEGHEFLAVPLVELRPPKCVRLCRSMKKRPTITGLDRASSHEVDGAITRTRSFAATARIRSTELLNIRARNRRGAGELPLAARAQSTLIAIR